MKITPLFNYFPQNRNINNNVSFKSTTVCDDEKIVEKDVLTLDKSKPLFRNYNNPTQTIMGINLNRTNGNQIDILSRYNHNIGTITYNPNVPQPDVDILIGNFQPVIELKDDELGIDVLMFRGSELKSKNLNICYRNLNGVNISATERDINTIEEFLNTIETHSPENAKTFKSFDLRANINGNNVIYFDEQSIGELEKFKQKYGIEDFTGNVIVCSKKDYEDQNDATLDRNYALKLISKLSKSPKEISAEIRTAIEKAGMPAFINWYFNIYYPEYEKFLSSYFESAQTLDDLLKYQPNWAPWKLEEKQWLLDNPHFVDHPFDERQNHFIIHQNSIREIPFTLGKLPEEFKDKETYQQLVQTLKQNDIYDGQIHLNGTVYKAKRFRGGEYNNKFIYKISADNRDFILKFERINVEDAENLDSRHFSILEKKTIRKDKTLSGDSIYANACINRYLELNGCSNVPKMHYYDHTTHSALYEYIQDPGGDAFQNGEIDEEYTGLQTFNTITSKLNDLGIYINDSAEKNILTDENGEKKVIDLGFACFINPLKPGVKKFNVEFSNTNGPDLRSIFSSIFLAMHSQN